MLLITSAFVALSFSSYRVKVNLNVIQQAELTQDELGQRDNAAVLQPREILFSTLNYSDAASQTSWALQREYLELRARLDFMVFAQERKETQQALVKVLQQQINIAPFNSALWRDLLFVQQGLVVSDDEFKNTFLIAKKLSKWNIQQRSVLLNRCVNEYQKLQLLSPTLCADIFANLPLANDIRRLSSLSGVEYSRLLEFLQELGLPVLGDLK